MDSFISDNQSYQSNRTSEDDDLIEMLDDEIENSLDTSDNDEDIFDGVDEEELNDEQNQKKGARMEEYQYVRKRTGYQKLEFPKYIQLKKLLKKVTPIPEDYKFQNLGEYIDIMQRLESEKYFRELRIGLREEVFKIESEEKVASSSTYNGFQLIKNYKIESMSFDKEGFVIKLIATMRIPKYQQELWQIYNNQILFFIHKKEKTLFVGKAIQAKEYSEEKERYKKMFFDDDYHDFGNNFSDDEEEKEEEIDDFKMIDYPQQIKIRMDATNSRLRNIFTNTNFFVRNPFKTRESGKKKSEEFFLAVPHEYWFSYESSVNCKRQFHLMNEIAFPEQTIGGSRGKVIFPQYSFLDQKNDQSTEVFKSVLDQTVKEQTDLDSYQQLALRHALFNQNAIIQGPPGTGKTFLACRIVTLLNKIHQQHINKPILVLSQKNLSLDSLLSKILDANPDIKLLRLGQQSESSIIQSKTLQEQDFNEEVKRTKPKCSTSYFNISKEVIEYEKYAVQKYSLVNCLKKVTNHKDLEFSKECVAYIFQRFIELLCKDLNLNVSVERMKECMQTFQSIFLIWLSKETDFSQDITNNLKKIDIVLKDTDQQQLKWLVKDLLKQNECEQINSEDELKERISKFTTFKEFTLGLRNQLISFQDKAKYQPLFDAMKMYQDEYHEARQKSDKKYQKDLAKFMKGFNIIGMTFTGYHMNYSALQQLGAEIVVIEEASEIIESEFYPILTPTMKHLIQIGDHQQLRPTIKSNTLQSRYNYRLSYFERLITVNNIKYVTLNQQRRMRPEFANFTRLFYGPKYLDDITTKKRQFVKEISADGMFMLQHSFPEYKQSDFSYTNLYEALFIKNLVVHLISKCKIKSETISIISSYKSQKILIKNILNKEGNSKENNQSDKRQNNRTKHANILQKVEVYTIDKFQGNENDIIILSCVRSNNEFNCGFILNDHRINVAFSRARIGFFCIGNFEQYASVSSTWQKIINLSKSQFSYGEIPKSYCNNIDERVEKELDRQKFFQDYVDYKCNLCSKHSHIGKCQTNNIKMKTEIPSSHKSVSKSTISLNNPYQKELLQYLNGQIEVHNPNSDPSNSNIPAGNTLKRKKNNYEHDNDKAIIKPVEPKKLTYEPELLEFEFPKANQIRDIQNREQQQQKKKDPINDKDKTQEQLPLNFNKKEYERFKKFMQNQKKK